MSRPLYAGLAALAAALNLAAFALCGYDKARARRGGRRVPERTLLALALLGGSPGLLLGMLAFRHKTQKPRFSVGVPLLLALQLALLFRLLK